MKRIRKSTLYECQGEMQRFQHCYLHFKGFPSRLLGTKVQWENDDSVVWDAIPSGARLGKYKEAWKLSEK